jgi:uncharacterized membrane protein YkoI
MRGIAMHASPKLTLRLLLSPLVMATVLAAPCAFAKKDLFATEPGAKNAPAAQQLVPASSTASEESKTDTNPSDAPKPGDAGTAQAPGVEAKKETLEAQKEVPKAPAAKEPSAIDVQLARLKRNLTKTKNDLFGGKESSEKKVTTAPAIEPQLADSKPVEDEAKTEVATISATEAAQRAQTLAEGQVINVRLYHESGLKEDKPRYAVKLLQKNGRMKTINLDAVNGALIEEKPAEETPQ